MSAHISYVYVWQLPITYTMAHIRAQAPQTTWTSQGSYSHHGFWNSPLFWSLEPECRSRMFILNNTILSCTMLYYTILYYTILYYTILYYTILYYTILYYTILYYTILYYTILYYTILYYTILYYTILYYTILYVNTSLYRELSCIVNRS